LERSLVLAFVAGWPIAAMSLLPRRGGRLARIAPTIILSAMSVGAVWESDGPIRISEACLSLAAGVGAMVVFLRVMAAALKRFARWGQSKC